MFFAGGIRFRESWLIMEYVMPISAIVGVYFTGGMRLRVLVEYVRRFSAVGAVFFFRWNEVQRVQVEFGGPFFLQIVDICCW